MCGCLMVKNQMVATASRDYRGCIFTVPHQLNAVCLHNQRIYYDILFASVWNTLHSFGYSHYGSETGAVAVLHTCGQNMSLHPHIHCIVPAAGYTLDGRWKEIGHSGQYLYPVHQLRVAFKGKFPDRLKRALRKKNELALFDDRVQAAYKNPMGGTPGTFDGKC